MSLSRLMLSLSLLGVVACTVTSEGSKGGAPNDAIGTDDNTNGSGGSTDPEGNSTGSPTSGGGGSGATSGIPGGGEDAGPPTCQEIIVDSQPTIPEMLIVLDKSASMVFPGCDALDFAEGVPFGCVNVLGLPQTPPPPHDKPFDRWAPSVSAIKGLTAQLQSKISFGLMLFPGVEKTCSSGSLAVDPEVGNADEIAVALSRAQPDGDTTPTPGVLSAARALLDTPAAPDRIEASKYVLLVTDGVPNCTAAGQNDTSTSTPKVAENDSFAAVDALAQSNVRTYVIGFDTAAVPELATVLDEMARRGGTGDVAHRPVEDEASLIAELETITAAVASCTFTLGRKAEDAEYVRVTLDGTDIALGETGWELVNEVTLELRGDACATLQNGRDHQLSIKVECDRVVVL